jgi:hypothetical protein
MEGVAEARTRQASWMLAHSELSTVPTSERSFENRISKVVWPGIVGLLTLARKPPILAPSTMPLSTLV